ncbi:hypothetical protein N9241_00780 [bacterium]|nr:hypothetical protein [bacterium]
MKKTISQFVKRLTNLTGLREEHQQIAGQIEHLTRLVEQQISDSTQRSRVSSVDPAAQKLLALAYRQLAGNHELLSFDEVEFVNYSQTGEDGILHYIFSLVGTTNKYCVEFCAGDGIQCNSANLIINEGWHGLLCDGDKENVEKATHFYQRHPNTCLIPPCIIQQWLTAENINDVLHENGFSGDIDLLSIDVDGVDYWLWKALEAVAPRVVLVEVNAAWGSEMARTVQYKPDFVADYVREGQKLAVYGGASLAALVSLGRAKGYRLVGANRYGFNAVFMRDDVGQTLFPEVTAESCLRHPVAQWNYQRVRPMLDQFDWVAV